MLAPIENLERAFARLPGFGRRSANRAVLALLREDERLAAPLVAALEEARRSVVCCTQCGGFTIHEQNPCALCTDPLRDHHLLCVVEDAADILTLESSHAFNGIYHVLGGKLSPATNTPPERLRITELVERIPREGITEVVLALSTDMEGDATAAYLAEVLPPCTPNLKLTQLAFGLPAGSGIGYSDPLTLRRALQHRLSL